VQQQWHRFGLEPIVAIVQGQQTNGSYLDRLNKKKKLFGQSITWGNPREQAEKPNFGNQIVFALFGGKQGEKE
jgi:hypothetical protein